MQAYSALAETLMFLLIYGFRKPSLLSNAQEVLNAAAVLMLDDVEAAFLFVRSGPAAGALVFAFGDGPGARPAADARIALIVERVVRNSMLGDE